MALGVTLPFDAGAWGFGRAQTSAVLGVPLDFNVALRLEPGEVPPECLSVDVTVGDIPLARSAVSAVLDTTSATPLVRVRTSLAIDEPLVQVNLSAGCSSRVTRRFTLLADPPGHMASPGLANADAVVAGASNALSPNQAPAAAAVPAPAGSAPVARTATAAAGSGSALDAASRSAGTSPSMGATLTGHASAKDIPTSAGPKRQPAEPRKAADPGQLADARAATPDKPTSPATARPRLQLDAPTIATKPAGAGPAAAKAAALLAAEEAASAARAAASAAEARAAAMEKNIEALRQEAKANRESLAKLTQALQEAQSGPDVPFAMWGALAGLGALSALLLLRVRRQRSGEGQAPWWSSGSSASAQATEVPDNVSSDAAASPDGTGELPVVSAKLAPVLDKGLPAERQEVSVWVPSAPTPAPVLGSFDLNAEPARRELPPLADPEELDAFDGGMDRTQLLPPSVSTVSAPIQGVSIEELLDLEQQVEFFTVLGQDDAALSLLVEHLRSTGGTYPLPYLKLMEIYRRKGDEDSYERTRDRFNQRFNAVAPSWGAATPQDRHLEDLPDVLRRIQQVWPRPVDAMALLENMLVRTEGGTLLEMSALGEVLFLFTLARDLHEQEEGAAGPVDVLLPLDDMFGDAPAQPGLVGSSPASQFSASSLSKLAGPAVAVAGLSAAAVSRPAPLAEDHFDLPLGEPMFEPVFDEPAPLAHAASTRQEEPAAYQISMPGSLDLPLAQEAPARGTPAPAEDPFLEPLSFDLPELESIQAPLPSKADSAAPVDLDISLDGLELEPVAPKLSPGEEQAASNFGLFIDSPPAGKPR